LSTITEDHVIQALKFEKVVFEKLMSSAVGRSFPSKTSKFFTTDTVEILKKVLEDGYVPFDETNEGIQNCYQMGWIHRSLLSDGTQQDSVHLNIGVLPSRLHEKYVSHLYLLPFAPESDMA
jgi:hypothetical protein